jgi:hypothetical protein
MCAVTTDEPLREEETSDERLREQDTSDERSREEETTIAARAPWSLSDDTDLALGKYARAGSGRGHGARAACSLKEVTQRVMGGRGEVVFVGLLVFLPGLCIPDLHVVN